MIARLNAEHASAAELADAFLSLRVPDPWRPAFDRWADQRRLSAELKRAVVVAILRARVFAATARHRPRERRRA